MLRIAVPNKGSLAEPAADMLRQAGYKVRRDLKELIVTDPDNEVELFYLRPRDIAVYVGSGTVDAGITGRDLLLDSGSDAVEVMALGFGKSTFRYAARAGSMSDVADIAGRRVETGATLRSQGLAVFGDPILTSEAVLIRRAEVSEDNGVGVLRRRLLGVVTARDYVLLDYDVPAAAVEAACQITPGLESPTVSPLHDPAWVAVRAMVPRKGTNRVMDELFDLGARGILVTHIAACRL